MVKYTYNLLLSEYADNAIDFGIERGYYPNIAEIAGSFEELPTGCFLYSFTEPQAWEFQEKCEELGEAFLTCMNGEIVEATYQLLDEIV